MSAKHDGIRTEHKDHAKTSDAGHIWRYWSTWRTTDSCAPKRSYYFAPAVRSVCCFAFVVTTNAYATLNIRDSMGDVNFMTAAALVDTIDQSLSSIAYGEDMHSHFRAIYRVPFGHAPTVAQENRFGKMDICNGPDALAQWGAQNCRASKVVSQYGRCKDNQRCISVILANFVLENSEYMRSIKQGLRDPCSAVPDSEKLAARHGVPDPKAPGATVSPKESKYWLFCDTKRSVDALITSNNDATGSFNITWQRKP